MTTIYARDLQVAVTLYRDGGRVAEEIYMSVVDAASFVSDADNLREWEEDNELPRGTISSARVQPSFMSTRGADELPLIMYPRNNEQLQAVAEVCAELDTHGLSAEEYAAYMHSWGADSSDYPDVEGVNDSIVWRGDYIEDGARAVYEIENGEGASDLCDESFDFVGWMNDDNFGRFRVGEPYCGGTVLKCYVIFM